MRGYGLCFVGAITVGYLTGKISAFPEYKRKLLQLQEGYLVDEIREGRTGFNVIQRW